MTTPPPPFEDAADGRVHDAAAHNGVDRYAPASLRPYLRLARIDRPIGGWLLFWPCAWSIGLAAIARSDMQIGLGYLALFFIGAFAMRGAGCTWNDIVDRAIDAQVERTRSRPLPSGQVSLKGAYAFLGLQLLVGLGVLLFLPHFAKAIALLSLVPVITYPFMKRITFWPQVVLGLCFSWGALMGWAVLVGSLAEPAPYLLYLGAVAWVIGYDTIYALQDIEDDIMVGVGSTARRFGHKVRQGVAVFYIFAVLSIGAALFNAGATLAAWFGFALFTTYLTAQVVKLERNNPTACLMWFQSNNRAGLVLAAGLLADAVLRAGLF